MPITIKGIRIVEVTIAPHKEDKDRVVSNYELISSADKVLARQGVGGYSGLAVELTDKTKAALQEFLKCYSADINATLGLDIEG